MEMREKMERVKFSEKELEHIGEYMTPGGPMPRYATPVTARENYLNMLKGEKPLWMPIYYDFRTFVPKIVPDHVARAFVIESEAISREEMGGKDMFGIDWEYIDVAGGSMVKPGAPLLEDASEWREKVVFPAIESWDWEGCRARNDAFLHTERVTVMWFFTGLYERLISFMDFEGAVMALIDEDQKQHVHDLFDKLCDLYIQIIDKYKEYFDLDVLYFHDDWGAQRAPFFSLDTCREMLVPYLRRIVDFCHKNHIVFEFHSCGKNEMLVPAMVEAGVDVWAGQPINDKALLYEEYGKDIVLGVDIDFPENPTDEQAEEAVRAFLEKYGQDMEEKPVYCCTLVMPQNVREQLYIQSRKLFA